MKTVKHNGVYKNPKTNEYLVLFEAPHHSGNQVLDPRWGSFNLSTNERAIWADNTLFESNQSWAELWIDLHNLELVYDSFDDWLKAKISGAI